MMANMWCRIVALMIAGAAVQGCAQPAQVSGMIAPPPTTDAWVTSPYAGAMSVAEVTGGEETDPMWKSMVGNGQFHEALQHSLAANKLLAATPEAAKYTIKAELKELSQPFMGFDMTVSAKVNYQVAAKDASELAFGQVIDSEYTATVSDAFLGVERLKLANEGAIRENIKEFIKRLVAAPPPNPTTGPRPVASLR
jgi:hypothetical protein